MKRNHFSETSSPFLHNAFVSFSKFASKCRLHGRNWHTKRWRHNARNLLQVLMYGLVIGLSALISSVRRTGWPVSGNIVCKKACCATQAGCDRERLSGSPPSTNHWRRRLESETHRPLLARRRLNHKKYVQRESRADWRLAGHWTTQPRPTADWSSTGRIRSSSCRCRRRLRSHLHVLPATQCRATG